MGNKQKKQLLAIQLIFLIIFSILQFVLLFSALRQSNGLHYDDLHKFTRDFLFYFISSLGSSVLSIIIPLLLTFLLFATISMISNLQKPIRKRRHIISQYRREAPFAAIWLIFVAISGLTFGLIIKNNAGKVYYSINDYGWIYFSFSILFIIVVFDTVFYWYHRFLHWGPIYKYVHSIHHATTTPHWLSQFNTSPIEHLYQVALYSFILLFIPIHPAALVIIGVIATIKSFVGHLGREIYPTSTLFNPYLSWSTTVTHHEQHHAFGPYNYSFFFTWWDRLMGTEHPSYSEEFQRAKINFN